MDYQHDRESLLNDCGNGNGSCPYCGADMVDNTGLCHKCKKTVT